jgi:diguanylate cyclase (GGDEF)-like protein
MDQAIARASRAKESIALLYIDLDGFKPVNDVFGHDRGDFLLQQVASRLVESVRTEDTVCRLGGDEFVILLPFLANSEEPVLIAQRIHTALEPVFAILPSAQKISNPPKLSACIGISIFPDHGADTETLLRHADQAMYQAKAEGPGSFSVYHRSGKL